MNRQHIGQAVLMISMCSFAMHGYADSADTAISTRPDPHGGYSTGIGDLNLFDIFLLKTEGIQSGIGPQITAPTAAQDELGTGKWQAG